MTNEEKRTLEDVIDRSNLTLVLETIGEICREKAEHIRANWQDNATAKTWERDAREFEKAAQKTVN